VVVCLPHPFAPGWKGVNFGRERRARLLDPEFMAQIDMIEVINSHLNDSRNFKGFMLSELWEKAVSAGSDAHRLAEVGAAYLSFGENLNRREIWSLLRSRTKVGADAKFGYFRTMNTSRGVILNHLMLYFRKKRQARWMLPYEYERPYDPATMPERRRKPR
jgi:hypothetical protein